MLPGSEAAPRALFAIVRSPSHGLIGSLLVALVVAGFLLAGTLAGAVLFAVGLGLSALALLDAVRRVRPERRTPWVLVATGAVALALVMVPRGYTGFSADGTAANPLTAVATVLLVAGTLLLVRPEHPDRDPTIFLDAGLLASAAGIACWYLLAQPWFNAGGDPSLWLDGALSTIYATLDLALLGVAAYTIWNQHGMARAQWLLTAMLVANTITDLGVFYGFTGVGYRPGQVTDLGMALIVPFAAAAALQPSAGRPIGLHRRKGDERVLGLRLVGVTAAMAIGPLLLLLFGILHELGLSYQTPAGMPGIEVQLGIMSISVVGMGTLRLFLTVARLERVHRTRDGLESELKRQALVDGLTALPNRRSFTARLAAALAQPSGASTAVLFCDMDDFKTVNDTLGHGPGDRLLVETSRRLNDSIRPGDTACRLSGDEFAILLDEIGDVERVIEVAQRILQRIAQPFDLGRDVSITASLGIAMVDADVRDVEDLLGRADIAMYAAKAAGKACQVVYEPAMRDRAWTRLELETELRRAIERDELTVVYQPILDLRTRTPVEMEALVRWDHPTRGRLAPADFLGAAEESGLIVPLGHIVLERACAQAAAWRRTWPGAPLDLSVNLSSRQFRDPGLLEMIRRALDGAGLPASCLKVEITESAMLDADASDLLMRRIRDMGIRLAVDDFGTGYSGLSYFQRFPLDTLKIDRSFVAGLGRDPRSDAIVHATIAFAKALGLTVTAEGIETEDQFERVRALGADRGQGYLFARPLEPAAVETYLAAAARGLSAA
jgi:diguanylate cyclase (GGDEF)-like protein